MADIDDLIRDDEEEQVLRSPTMEPKEVESLFGGEAQPEPAVLKTELGTIEHFFSKLGVAAIHLSGDLKVGDTIEIDNDGGPVRITVSSMQIDRKDVDAASSGDSVGIKVDREVKQGSKVFLAW